jgi:2-C-methyl-D-erythritol 4-phosphate cytidylyltransferase
MVKQEKKNKGSIKTVAVILGAGAGLRMGGGTAKQFLEVDGKPILALTLEKFQTCPLIDSITLVVPLAEINSCKSEIVERFNFDKVENIVLGGERRQDSVRFGLEASNGEYELVVIHDGVRPFIDMELIDRSIAAAKIHRAVIAALPAKETVKKVDQSGFVIKTYERKDVWLVQTPQVFRYKDIMSAHEKAVSEAWDDFTDDASLIEKMGIPVKVILGSEYNIKITTPQDMELARYLLARSNNKGQNYSNF